MAINYDLSMVDLHEVDINEIVETEYQKYHVSDICRLCKSEGFSDCTDCIFNDKK